MLSGISPTLRAFFMIILAFHDPFFHLTSGVQVRRIVKRLESL